MLDLSQIQIKKEKEEKDYGYFVIEPLDPGFGQTVGVALRRVLLSCLSGGAIIQVKIAGVKHPFSTIKGMSEDVVEFILNLKKVRINIPDDKEVKLSLNVRGPREVKAKDISVSGAQITNPDQILAHLADSKSKISATFIAKKSSGFSPAEDRKTSEIGVIPIDASFSPIQRVNYKVDLTRVGRVTNYDRLTLEVWSDGAISPSDALEEAAKILVSRVKVIYEPPEVPKESKEPKTPQVSEEVLKTTLEELDLPIRVVNALKKGKIVTVEDFTKAPRRKLVGIKNLGPKSVTLVAEKLLERGVPKDSLPKMKKD